MALQRRTARELTAGCRCLRAASLILEYVHRALTQASQPTAMDDTLAVCERARRNRVA